MEDVKNCDPYSYVANKYNIRRERIKEVSFLVFHNDNSEDGFRKTVRRIEEYCKMSGLIKD